MQQQTEQRLPDRDAFIDFLVDCDLRWLLTLHFNKKVTVDAAQHYIGRFFQRLDRKLLGPNYIRKAHLRTSMFAFAEHLQTNTHWHCVGSLPFDLHDDPSAWAEQISEIWKDLWPAGSTHLERVTRTPRKLARYVTKELFKRDNRAAYLHSSMFWPGDHRAQRSIAAPHTSASECAFQLEDIQKSTRKLRQWSSQATVAASLSWKGRTVGLLLPLELYDGLLEDLPIINKATFQDPAAAFLKTLQSAGSVRVRVSKRRKLIVTLVD